MWRVKPNRMIEECELSVKVEPNQTWTRGLYATADGDVISGSNVFDNAKCAALRAGELIERDINEARSYVKQYHNQIKQRKAARAHNNAVMERIQADADEIRTSMVVPRAGVSSTPV